MASTVKKSFAIKKRKKEKEKMASDDFYKEAQKEHIRDIVAAGSNGQKTIRENIVEETPKIEEPVKQIVAEKPAVKIETAVHKQVIQQEEIKEKIPEEIKMEQDNPKNTEPQSVPEPTATEDLNDFDDFDFVDHYGDEKLDDESMLLPENTASSAINCAFVGVGGGGGKMAKSFLDLGFSRTVLINTTHKDQPEGVPDEHFLLLDGSDGVGKDVEAGRRVLSENSTLVEDTLRARLGKVDWLFVCASGGGGTGSASSVLHSAYERYLASVQGNGKVVYIISSPTSQELLNPTIKSNAQMLRDAISDSPHIVVDNEKQLQLLRGKVGMLGMYPTANRVFAKMLAQVLKLAAESSPVQTFDTKDLEKCLQQSGRMFLGTCAIRDSKSRGLGLQIFKSCAERSPCPGPEGRPATGVLLLVVNSETASDPTASNQMESAISYVGGRSETLFSGVYVRNSVPGLIAIMALGGMK